MFDLYDDDEPFRGRMSGREAPSEDRASRGRRGSFSTGSGRFTRPSRTFSQRAYVHSKFTYSPGSSGTGRHVEYIQRDGAGKDGDEPELFTEDGETVDAEAFAERSENDNHQFRFIVSPENSHELDMHEYVDDWMHQMEDDVGQDLDWAAAVHQNTDQPHAHIVVRGNDEQGNEVRLAPHYLHNGLRHRAEEIATHHLGPRTVDDKVQQFDREVSQTRVTEADRVLQAHQQNTPDDTGVRVSEVHPDTPGMHQKHLQKRARKLERLGLANRNADGEWELEDDVLDQLDELQRSKKMDRHMQAHGYDTANYHTQPPDSPVVARVGGQGISHGPSDDQYVIAEGANGGLYHLENEGDRVYEGEVVELDGRSSSTPDIQRQDVQSMDAAVHADGPTWLDKHLYTQAPDASTEAPPDQFQGELQSAAGARRDILEGRDLITSEERHDPPSDLVKRLREYERDKFAHELADTEGRAVEPVTEDSSSFTGTISERRTLHGGDVFVARNEDALAVVPANKHLADHTGERVSINRKEHNGRVRTFVDTVSRDEPAR